MPEISQSIPATPSRRHPAFTWRRLAILVGAVAIGSLFVLRWLGRRRHIQPSPRVVGIPVGSGSRVDGTASQRTILSVYGDRWPGPAVTGPNGEYRPASAIELRGHTLLADGLDAAVIGEASRGEDPIAVYDADACIELLMHELEADYSDAAEYFHHNVECAYVGPQTPLFVWLHCPMCGEPTLACACEGEESAADWLA